MRDFYRRFSKNCNLFQYKGMFSSVQFSYSVVSSSLQPHERHHARSTCPSPAPRVHPNSHPSSRWCHPTISSSVSPFSSHPQSFPASGFFPMSQLFASGGQNTGVSASASVLPMNTQDWSPLGWTGWIMNYFTKSSLFFPSYHLYWSIVLNISLGHWKQLLFKTLYICIYK